MFQVWRCSQALALLCSISSTRETNDEVAKQIDHAIAGVVFLGLLVGANLGLAAGDTGGGGEGDARRRRRRDRDGRGRRSPHSPLAMRSFKDRLYVFCGDAADGSITAHGANSALVGQSMRDIKDKAGKPIGEEFSVAAEGEYNAVEYVCRARARQSLRRKRRTSRKPAPGLRCGLL